MKQAYQKFYMDHGGCIWEPAELTGKCKKIVGGPSNKEHHYYQAQRRIFGIPFGKYWVHEDSIMWFDPVVETIYDCEIK